MLVLHSFSPKNKTIFSEFAKRMLPNVVTTVSQVRSRFTESLAIGAIACGLLISSPVLAQDEINPQCPNLAVYYPVVFFAKNPQPDASPDENVREQAQWTQLAATLAGIQASCLR